MKISVNTFLYQYGASHLTKYEIHEHIEKLSGVQIIFLIESLYFKYYYSYLRYIRIMHISDIDHKNELL